MNVAGNDRNPQTDPVLMQAVQEQPVRASLTSLGQLSVLSVVRTVDAPPEHVWALLTQPHQVALWSPITPSRALDSLGLATTQEDPQQPPVLADVLAAQTGKLLCHRWGQDTLRWELSAKISAETDKTTLALQHSFTDVAMASSLAAGWHICLAALSLRSTGQQVDRPVGRRAMDYGWEKLMLTYADLLEVPAAQS